MATRTPCTHTPTVKMWHDGKSDIDGVLGIEPGWYPDYSRWYLTRLCEHRNCQHLVCPMCDRSCASFGPVECPCATYPDIFSQRPRPRSFSGLKPSIARRRSGRHRARSKKR